MYFIQWASTGKTKWVKRLNLLFANESKSGFSFRCVTGALLRLHHGVPVYGASDGITTC